MTNRTRSSLETTLVNVTIIKQYNRRLLILANRICEET